MTSYRPSYGNPYDYPPPPGAMPPLPRGPPPSYDQYPGGDSYRPPQTDFSFRMNDRSHFPREHMQESGQSRSRNNHYDNKNLNQARRGRTYKPRAAYRAVPADRPLLRHHDQNGSTEQMLGMANGQKFMAAEDISDSDEEQMVESESDAGQSDSDDRNLVHKPMATEDGQVAEESLEPAAKRRALTSIYQNHKDAASEPKWSNPDPYTVLPPIDEQRKRKDVVKLIRKSRKEAEGSTTELNRVAANDDFISFGMENGEVSASPSPSVDERDDTGGGVTGAPTAPRSFSHLHNLHGQESLDTPNQPVNGRSLGPPPSSVQDFTTVPEEVVLDTPQHQSNSHTTFGPGGDEALGNRKRTRDDNIKGHKNGASHINGSILYDWVPPPSTNPTPWLCKTGMLTANAGFRLHKEICDFYDFVKPQHFEQTVRQELLSRLQKMVTDEIPHASVLCFGSFAAGMYLPNADMDVVIVSNSFRTTGHKVICQTRTQLQRFSEFVRSSNLGTSVETIANARVPLIKFVDRLTGIRVDVSFENDTGILANDTFARWRKEYPAMPVLVTVIKQFLMMRGLNEVVHGGLGGFSVTCLVTSLLQNMPRVQNGELVPEQHLGEVLVEFLDFYGNRLDTSRTGIMMRPPGYFEKQNFRRPRQPSQSVYQANKTDRLAIMDPNQAYNDISGGSRLVLLIFERFSHAHTEILRAMKTPARISLLDWSLGGNYDSFTFQRNRLRELYGDRGGLLGDISTQLHVTKMEYGGGAEPLTEAPEFVGDRPNADAVPKPEVDTKSFLVNGKKVPTKAESQESVHQAQAKRAAALKKKYPDMKGIPSKIGRGSRTKLIAKYRANRARIPETEEPAHPVAPSTRSSAIKKAQVTKPTKKGQARARALKKEYPHMKNIPDSINRSLRHKLIHDHLSQTIGALPPAYLSQPPNALPPNTLQNTAKHIAHPREERARPHQIPQHPSYPAEQRQQINSPPRQILHHEGDTGRPMSNKMAPLSDERRAEVARNLEGTSNDDPINLD